MVADAYRDSIHILAEADVVFDYFTRPEALIQWMGDRAVLDPRPGGEFTVFVGESRIEGRYVELDRPHRIVVRWGRGGSSSFPPEVSTLEVTFRPEGGGTRVEIVHSGLPAAEFERHALGWRHYLARLRDHAHGIEPIVGAKSGPACVGPTSIR